MIAIVAAMREELAALLAAVHAPGEPVRVAGRTLHTGTLGGHDVVVVLSGIGKVAAAQTATIMLQRFAVDAVVLVGTAGGLADDVATGDVVVARELLQHDLDARPLFPRWEVPLSGRARYPTDHALSTAVREAARAVLAAPPGGSPAGQAPGTRGPRVHEGLVVSGDVFVADADAAERLRADLPEALAVEMEGAAVAQVCTDHEVPFAVVRAVSDRADAAAPVDFAWFVQHVAARLAHDVVHAMLGALPRERGPV